jgi:hypothetical protein
LAQITTQKWRYTTQAAAATSCGKSLLKTYLHCYTQQTAAVSTVAHVPFRPRNELIITICRVALAEPGDRDGAVPIPPPPTKGLGYMFVRRPEGEEQRACPEATTAHRPQEKSNSMTKKRKHEPRADSNSPDAKLLSSHLITTRPPAFDLIHSPKFQGHGGLDACCASIFGCLGFHP